MAFVLGRGHATLRRGRSSSGEAEYFLTFCTAGRQAGLPCVQVRRAIRAEIASMDGDGTWTTRCGNIMPDHVHLLVILGSRLSLSRAVQRLKAKTGLALHSVGLSWERGFFDRRIRPTDEMLAVFLYIYLNPYRAGLMGTDPSWPGYFCRSEDWEWFRGFLNRDLPIPEWLL